MSFNLSPGYNHRSRLLITAGFNNITVSDVSIYAAVSLDAAVPISIYTNVSKIATG